MKGAGPIKVASTIWNWAREAQEKQEKTIAELDGLLKAAEKMVTWITSRALEDFGKEARESRRELEDLVINIKNEIIKDACAVKKERVTDDYQAAEPEDDQTFQAPFVAKNVVERE